MLQLSVINSQVHAFFPAGSVLVRERGSLVLTGKPKPVLGESCTTFLKDFTIFPPHKKKKKKKPKKMKSINAINEANAVVNSKILELY